MRHERHALAHTQRTQHTRSADLGVGVEDEALGGVEQRVGGVGVAGAQHGARF